MGSDEYEKEDDIERVTNFVDSSESITNESEDLQPFCKRWCSCLCDFILRNFLPVCMITLLIFGALVPAPGVFMSHLPTSYVAVVIIFLFNGLTLKTEDMKSALKEYKALICSIILILVVTPIVGAKLTDLLPYDKVSTESLPSLDKNATSSNVISKILGPGEIKIGFQVYFLMPCTIVTCIVMVTQLGGNIVLTMLVSVITNILAIFVVPLMLKWFTSFEADVKLNVGQILLKLVLTVLLPVMVGKLLRYIGKIQRTVDKYRKVISLISVVLLCLIPWMKVSQTSESNALTFVSVPGIFVCISWATFTHLLFLLLSTCTAFLFRFERSIFKTVMIVGSQKTLVLAVTVISFLPPEAGDQGLMSVPAIVAHLSIVVLDSLLIARFVAWERRNSEEDIAMHPDTDHSKEENSNEVAFETAV